MIEKLYRDEFNKAIINKDRQGYMIHLNEEKKRRELEETLKEVKDLKKDVDDIKHMLKLILNGSNKNG
jgi:hypothetical protein